MTGPDPLDNRRQVLYWRLLARLFDHEEQATLESASLAIVTDIGLPAALLDPQVSVDSIVQRHPELEAEFDIPIHDSVAVTVWKSLKLAGIDPSRVQGWGRVFAT